MTLDNLLDLLALQLGADGAQLIAYAAEDTLGGYHVNPAFRKWDVGSVWESEGKVLYALVRHLKPELIVEIGSLWGCSTAHLAAACKANGRGSVVSLDANVHGVEVGNAIPADLRPYIQQITARGEDWLAKQDAGGGIGLVFEDADHTTPTTALVSEHALRVLEPGGVLANHDAMHDLAILGTGQRVAVGEGKAIRRGLELARADFRTYITDESDCGLAITLKSKAEKRKPDEFITTHSNVLEAVEADAPVVMQVETFQDEPPAPKVIKRKPGRKPKAS